LIKSDSIGAIATDDRRRVEEEAEKRKRNVKKKKKKEGNKMVEEGKSKKNRIETRERETTSHSIVDRVYPNLQLKGRKGKKN
jgi:hypothetical protein